jgi:hypothetical protein
MDHDSRESAAPPGFGIEFLDWFRDITERSWAAWQVQYFAETEYHAFGSAPWLFPKVGRAFQSACV